MTACRSQPPPVQADQLQGALDKPGRLTRRHCRSDQWRSNVDHAEPSRGFARSGLKSVHRTAFRKPFTLHRQAGLNRVRRESRFASQLIPRINCSRSHPDGFLILRTTADGLAAPLAGRLRRPQHGRIKPDRQRPPALERVRHRARTSGASMAHCTRTSSGSCKSLCPVCSSIPVTTPDSQDESLTAFVQQSPCDGSNAEEPGFVQNYGTLAASSGMLLTGGH